MDRGSAHGRSSSDLLEQPKEVAQVSGKKKAPPIVVELYRIFIGDESYAPTAGHFISPALPAESENVSLVEPPKTVQEAIVRGEPFQRASASIVSGATKLMDMLRVPKRQDVIEAEYEDEGEEDEDGEGTDEEDTEKTKTAECQSSTLPPITCAGTFLPANFPLENRA